MLGFWNWYKRRKREKLKAQEDSFVRVMENINRIRTQTTLYPYRDYCECGWIAKPFGIIPCDDPQRGPLYCPDCDKPLGKYTHEI